jgi:pantoate--beta-alanine ligase
MKVVRGLTALNRPCAFVPTMGALHAGHQSLIKIAREYCDEVVVSVFVNPLQFEDKEDLAKYPKTPEIDELLARQAGATVLWRPEVGDLYPGNEIKLSAGQLGTRFEGASRAGHFDGVLTVVNRLFELVKPKYAIFGEKDFQQLFLIKQMAAQLHPEIEIIAAPTSREASGLALSSRNVRLSQEGLQTAQSISKALRAASTKDSLAEMKLELASLEKQPDFKLDYAEIIDEESFELATENTVRPRALIAGWIDGVRLIDNAAMTPSLVKL